MAPNSMQEALNSPPIANGNGAAPASENPDYYAKGSAEVATEDALTLEKIKHVSVYVPHDIS